MKIVHVVGARPNFMKAAPLIHELEQRPSARNILVHTGQHYDETMSKVFFEDLGLPHPDINLEVGSGSHAQQTAQIMLRLEPVLLEQQPDVVLVYGDVNSTLAGSLVAAKLQIPLGHIEAGVRSYDRSMPEEINRVVTDALSDLLFTPTQSAIDNLIREGIPREKIHFTGNVMVDSLLASLDKAESRQAWANWGLEPQNYAVLTLHRQANVDQSDTLEEVLESVGQIASRIPVIFPVHPRTLKRLNISGFGGGLRETTRLLFVEPLGYLDFLSLLSKARLVLTDSGGIQVETTILNVPCLTLRRNTEWSETLISGTNRLVGTDKSRILEAAFQALSEPTKPVVLPEGWDGKASHRIADILIEQFHR